MAQVLVNFRMDEEVKKQMEKACKEMGLNLSTAFNIFAKKVAKEQRIPFNLEVDPFYSEENMMRLRKAAERMEAYGDPFYTKENQERLRRSIAQMKTKDVTAHDWDEMEQYMK